MRKILFSLIVMLIAAPVSSAWPQEVQVSRSNKTISVIATETVQADPDLAEIRVGYQNYGRTKEAAYEENTRIANLITKALLDAGIPKENIETQGIHLERISEGRDLPPEIRKERQFEASQSWTVRVGVRDAQKTVDIAVAAGANSVEDVSWTVKEPLALDAKAHSAALAKARSLADQITKGLGAKLGDLLFVSNEMSNSQTRVRRFYKTVEISVAAPPPPPQLTLFPQKVRQEAAVHAVFALE